MIISSPHHNMEKADSLGGSYGEDFNDETINALIKRLEMLKIKAQEEK